LDILKKNVRRRGIGLCSAFVGSDSIPKIDIFLLKSGLFKGFIVRVAAIVPMASETGMPATMLGCAPVTFEAIVDGCGATALAFATLDRDLSMT